MADIKPKIDNVIDRILSIMETEVIKIEMKEKPTFDDKRLLSTYLASLTTFKRIDIAEEKKITEEITTTIGEMSAEQIQALIEAEKKK